MEISKLDLGMGSVEPATIAPSPPEQRTLDRSLEQVDAAALKQRPFQDMPNWIWKLFFGSWAALFTAFVITFGVSDDVRFVLGVIAAFATVFFVTPLVLLRLTQRGRRTHMPSRGHGVDLLNGRCSDIEAAVQIVLLPFALTVGLIAIGLLVPR